MNNFQLLLEMGKVYVVGTVVEKTIRAFGSNNKADLIKAFTVVCCGCCIILIFLNSFKVVDNFWEGVKYYGNPVNYMKALWIFAKNLVTGE
ncbi:TPA: hypothetical protein ACXDAY_002311 [Clostridium botulinum]|uniref:hypothetical protein n=1 Tax=Clostridium botulinum TaxID=1491 RepID=UPI0004643634|nr:hypothetical protein [Clostridium botulinum]APH21001.1 hypothetical protein NPD1_4341 [Clostridium botulinum]APQ71260.1 hypothetical protein RSJ8_4298 [Clostridium botulinum]APR02335.1 hypothetical protein RSJ2_4159 [Clostridium botulinum]AUN01405.1 hypothetical protein RSJ19_00040 [Clostridium botulinum]MBN3351993.1 hypothetical protein [Clostridium botulinum]